MRAHETLLARVLTLALALAWVAPAFLTSACAGGEAEAEAQVDLRDPAELGTFAAEVERTPARADEVLDEAGISREELYRAILAVASDPEASRQYRDAFVAALGTEDQA